MSKVVMYSTLLKGMDNNKDQSYFLHAVEESAIARSLFPVGELEKSEVRKIAEDNGFVTSKKKDSTGICFIGERRFSDFLKQYLPAQPGRMKTPEGIDMGEHQGFAMLTGCGPNSVDSMAAITDPARAALRG